MGVVIESENDREFAEIIHAIANRRKTDRSVGIEVTPNFQSMAGRISLLKFRDYILSRYPYTRDKSAYEKYDLVDMSEQELKSFDRGFPPICIFL